MVSALNVMVAVAPVHCICLTWPCLHAPPCRQSHTKEDWGGLGTPLWPPSPPPPRWGARPGCATQAGHLPLSLLPWPHPPGAVLPARRWNGTAPGTAGGAPAWQRGPHPAGFWARLLHVSQQGCKSGDPEKHLANDACKIQASREMMLAEKESAEEAGRGVRPCRGGSVARGGRFAAALRVRRDVPCGGLGCKWGNPLQQPPRRGFVQLRDRSGGKGQPRVPGPAAARCAGIPAIRLRNTDGSTAHRCPLCPIPAVWFKLGEELVFARAAGPMPLHGFYPSSAAATASRRALLGTCLRRCSTAAEQRSAPAGGAGGCWQTGRGGRGALPEHHLGRRHLLRSRPGSTGEAKPPIATLSSPPCCLLRFGVPFAVPAVGTGCAGVEPYRGPSTQMGRAKEGSQSRSESSAVVRVALRGAVACDGCAADAGRMLNRCGTDAWWMHGGCVVLPGGYVADSQQTQGGCTAEARWMHGGCRADARQKRAVRTADAGRMQGSCTAAAWQMPELPRAAGPTQHLHGTGARPVRRQASGSTGRALGRSRRRPCMASADTNYINCPAGE